MSELLLINYTFTPINNFKSLSLLIFLLRKPKLKFSLFTSLGVRNEKWKMNMSSCIHHIKRKRHGMRLYCYGWLGKMATEYLYKLKKVCSKTGNIHIYIYIWENQIWLKCLKEIWEVYVKICIWSMLDLFISIGCERNAFPF